ncbi:MAG: helix-turn-helix domain-containing protein [Deltaproteobacteria bacterium]|nr:helix-turn-helix domain-containing protein [Deltaproteobacteria bacterium]
MDGERQGGTEQGDSTACLEYGFTLTEIARHLGVHYSTISKIVNQRSG